MSEEDICVEIVDKTEHIQTWLSKEEVKEFHKRGYKFQDSKEELIISHKDEIGRELIFHMKDYQRELSHIVKDDKAVHATFKKVKRGITYIEEGREKVKGTSVSYEAGYKYRIPLLTQREIGWLIDAMAREETYHKKLANEALENDHYKSWEGRQDAHDLQLDNAEVCDRVCKILWWTINPNGMIDYSPEMERLDEKQKHLIGITPNATANAIQLVNNGIYHLKQGYFDKYAIIENLKKIRTMLGGKKQYAGVD
jgi:hypothetical protein